MSRSRARLSPDTAPARAWSWAEQLLASALVIAALLLSGVRGGDVAPRASAHAEPSLHSGSRAPLLDAAPRRLDVQVRRERVWLDLPPLPLASAPSASRLFAAVRSSSARLLGPGREPARDLRVAQFRRRIPRMNSEEPPCG